jgi:hypothetical protein
MSADDRGLLCLCGDRREHQRSEARETGAGIAVIHRFLVFRYDR